MKKYYCVVIICFLISCSSTPSKITIDDLHPDIKSSYYSEGSNAGQVVTLEGLTEKIIFPRCSDPIVCGEVVYISCGIDGAIDYLSNSTGVVIANCGGRCNFGFSEEYKNCIKRCPPKEWKCD